jgi:hypothetical protein
MCPVADEQLVVKLAAGLICGLLIIALLGAGEIVTVRRKLPRTEESAGHLATTETADIERQVRDPADVAPVAALS